MGLTNNLGKLSNIITSTGSVVGIGNAGNSSYKLLVQGNNASVDSNGQNTIFLSAGTSVSYIDTSYIGGGSYVPMAFGTGGSEKMRINTTGSVGIGTTTPSNFNGSSFTGPFLDVAGIMQIKGTSANTIAALQFGGDTYRKALVYSSVGTDTPYLAFGVSTSGSSSSAEERMRITSSGNVGIGTSSPGVALEVNGRYRTTSTYTSAGTTVFEIYNRASNGYGLYMAASSGTNYAFKVADYADTSRFTVLGNGTVEYNWGGGFQTVMNANNQINAYYNGGGSAMYLNFSGNGSIYAGSSYTVLYSGSDRRIKSDINDAESTLNKILSLKPRTFKYKERPEFTTYGFIAQEVEEIMPELVRTSEGISMCNDEEIENQKSIESYGLIWASILVKSIQELEARIKTLENK